MKNRSKWIERISVDDSVSKAARVTLKSRLATVAHFLNLAARHADKTPEHVHQLRVSTRRCVAAIDVYDDVLPGKPAKWFRKRLRRMRKAAGEARDLDVLMERYERESGPSHAEFMRRVKKRRRKVQQPIIMLHEDLIATGKLKSRAKSLLRSIRRLDSCHETTLSDWAKSRFAITSASFFESAAPKDLKALHAFRVRGKDLRYSMELFANLFPPDFRRSAYPLVTQLQAKLGELNDHATACRILEAWMAREPSRDLADYLSGLIDRERGQLDESVSRFRHWWTPALAAELRDKMTVASESEQLRYGVYP